MPWRSGNIAASVATHCRKQEPLIEPTKLTNEHVVRGTAFPRKCLRKWQAEQRSLLAVQVADL